MIANMAETPVKDTTYNGWKNRQTWSVALWIGNDELLYIAAVQYAKARRNVGQKPTYRGFISYAGLNGGFRTPDGISYTGARLDIKALNEMMAEYANV